MDKYSVVIPTLWKSNRIHKLLSDLIECEYVDEIILIDNGNKYHEYYEKLDKVVRVKTDHNIYVNPAWNCGVELSKNKSIALINDDINFNTDIFGRIGLDLLMKFGFIGQSELNYTMDEVVGDPHLSVDKNESNVGWGCFILFHKAAWITIPHNIKVWYGDNFIREINPYPKAVLHNFKIETEMSTTSNDIIFDEIKESDSKAFTEYFSLLYRILQIVMPKKYG